MFLNIIQNNFLTSNPQSVDQGKRLLAVLVSTFPEVKIKEQIKQLLSADLVDLKG